MNTAPPKPHVMETLPLLDPQYGCDEMNLVQFPMSVLATRAPFITDQNTGKPILDPETSKPKQVKTICYEDEILDPRSNKPARRSITITGSDKYGLPTSEDEEVIIALKYLTKEGGYLDQPEAPALSRRIYFHRKRLMHILGWPCDGKYYKRIKDSFARLKGVSILYERFWDEEAQRHCDTGFGVLSGFKFFDERGRAKTSKTTVQLTLPFPQTEPLSWFEWDSTLFENLKRGYWKSLDVEFFFKLKEAPAKRALRFLDDVLPKDGTAQLFDLREFCCERVGFSRDYKNSRLKELCQKRVVDPLEKEIELQEGKDRKTFVKRMSPKQRFVKTGRSFTGVWFARNAPVTQHFVSASLFEDLETNEAAEEVRPINPALVAELTSRELGRKAAEEFVRQHEADYLQKHIAYYDFLKETKPETTTAGYLRKSIEEDYGPPKGYKPKAERERIEQKEKERQHQESAKQAAERQQAARERAKQNHVQTYLKSLNKTQRRQLEDDALQNAEPDQQSLVESIRNKGPLHETGLAMLVEAEVLRRYPFVEDV